MRAIAKNCRHVFQMFIDCLHNFLLSYRFSCCSGMRAQHPSSCRAGMSKEDGIKNGKDIPLPNSTSSLSSSFTVIPVLQWSRPRCPELVAGLRTQVEVVVMGLTMYRICLWWVTWSWGRSPYHMYPPPKWRRPHCLMKRKDKEKDKKKRETM